MGPMPIDDPAASAPADDPVAVVIPAYNAELWIDETLRSVRSQTHQALDIVVVDDGSTDRTLEIVEAHVAADSRVRCVRQANAGVAAARNRGIAETKAALIAPIDADDLWAPDKIERQVARLRELGEDAGLIYSRFALIDADSRIVHIARRDVVEGDAVPAMCLSNIVGNGSAPLMRRSLVVAAGGYDPALHAAGAQGCEDYKLYFQVAERSQFGFVDACLVGYRDLPNNMSSQLDRMVRSRDLCTQEFRLRHPRHAALFDRGRVRLLRFNLARALRSRRCADAWAAFREMLRFHPGYAFAEVGVMLWRAARSRLRLEQRPGVLGSRFPIGVP
jgi:glycosyltransferase involved in cell wall biosynthesis